MAIKLPENFFRRLAYFIFGLTIGIMALNFFMSKKQVTFDYLPNARTLKSIRNKPHLIYAPTVLELMSEQKIDTTAIQTLLYYGNVNFSKSEVHTDPCKTYLIEPTKRSAPYAITVKRCDSIATITKLDLNYPK